MKNVKYLVLGFLCVACTLFGWSRSVKVVSVAGLQVKLSFEATSTTNALWVVWGTQDAQQDMSAWENRASLGVVFANETERTITLPNSLITSSGKVMRFILQKGVEDPGDYVQDGLVTWWDGINNAGTGEHVNDSSVWKDLAGVCDLNLTENCTWLDNGLLLSGFAAVATNATPVYKTIDVLLNIDMSVTTDWAGVIFSSASQKYDNQLSRGLIRSGHALQFTGLYRSLPTITLGDEKALISAAATYNEVAPQRIYQDGVQLLSPQVMQENWAERTNVAVLGARDKDDGRPAKNGVEVWGIRLYDRVLSADEIAANFRHDVVRFYGASNDATVEATSDAITLENAVRIVQISYDEALQPVQAQVAFKGVTTAQELVMAWDSEDKGTDLNQWAHYDNIGVIWPQDDYRWVNLNERDGLTVNSSIRFFLLSGVDAPTEYVTDSVLVWWDGLDNTGTGNFDPTSTVWKDKAGNIDLFITNNATWVEGKGLLLNGQLGAYGTNTIPRCTTMEVVYSMNNPMSYLLYSSGLKESTNNWETCSLFVCDSGRGITYFDGRTSLYDDNDTVRTPILGTRYTLTKGDWWGRMQQRSCTYNGEHHTVDQVFAQGDYIHSGFYSNGWGANLGVPSLGSRSHNHDYPWWGICAEMRFHSRALTQAELYANYKLDAVRYLGASRGNTVAVSSEATTCTTGLQPATDEVITQLGEIDQAVQVDLKTSDSIHTYTQRSQIMPFVYGVTNFPGFGKYIQSGLISRWDGIDNVGLGEHDSNSTKWVDLAGKLDLTLQTGGSWNKTGNGLQVNGFAAQGTEPTAYYRTIEVVYKMTLGRIMFTSGIGSRFVLFDTAQEPGTKGYFDGSANTIYVPWKLEPTLLRTMAGVYNASNTVTQVWGDGNKIANPKTLINTWGVGEGKVSIGNRASSGSEGYNWIGEVYAIRLYNRELSDLELQHNHALDMVRFNGATGEMTSRISVVTLQGEGEDITTWQEVGNRRILANGSANGKVAWYGIKGAWKAIYEVFMDGVLIDQQIAYFDLRNMPLEGTQIFLR